MISFHYFLLIISYLLIKVVPRSSVLCWVVFLYLWSLILHKISCNKITCQQFINKDRPNWPTAAFQNCGG